MDYKLHFNEFFMDSVKKIPEVNSNASDGREENCCPTLSDSVGSILHLSDASKTRVTDNPSYCT
jgi:hypothetical protein